MIPGPRTRFLIEVIDISGAIVLPSASVLCLVRVRDMDAMHNSWGGKVTPGDSMRRSDMGGGCFSAVGVRSGSASVHGMLFTTPDGFGTILRSASVLPRGIPSNTDRKTDALEQRRLAI